MDSYVFEDGSKRVRPQSTATYTLNYQIPGTACPTPPLTFTVRVLDAPQLPVATGADRLGTGPVTLLVTPRQGETYNWYQTNNSAAPALATGPSFTTGDLTSSQDFYVSATLCQESPRVRVPVVVYRVQLQVVDDSQISGTVPTGPVPLQPVVGVTLKAVPDNATSYTWKRNGVIVPTRSTLNQLTVYEPGFYTVSIPYQTEIAESKPIEVTDALVGQTVNGQPLNYISITDVLKPGITNPTQLNQLPAKEWNQNVTYLDGLGRDIQKVSVRASTGQTDVIQPISYDATGETPETRLPYNTNAGAGLFQANALTQQQTFYNSGRTDIAQDTRPYSSTVTEPSMLGRLQQSTAAGQAWALHPTTASYQSNLSSDAVHLWQGLDGSALYAPDKLTKQVSTDADGRVVEVFADLMGRPVLQRKLMPSGSPQQLDTYQVYDEVGHLSYTIPPAAVEAMKTFRKWSYTPLTNPTDQSFVDQWCYQYVYDDRGRLIKKKNPGAAWTVMCYDAFDRPILVQDGNGAAAGQWHFMKYDAQNRPVVQGVWQNAGTREQVQLMADDHAATNGAASEFETRTAQGYTTTNTFPPLQDGQNGSWLLSQTFYDDYNLDADATGTDDYSYRPQPQYIAEGQEPERTSRTRGLATVSRTRIVKPDNQYGGWLTTVVFYDQYGNVIQKQSNNQVNPSPSLPDVTTLLYREKGFVPQVERAIKHQETGIQSPVTVLNRLNYDHRGRVTEVWQQHEFKGVRDSEVLVAQSRYNALGQLMEKNLHSRGGQTFLQSVDFRYNLHGQLTHINNSALTREVNDPADDVFGLELIREQGNANGLGNTARFDGGVTAVRWKSHNSAQQNHPERERSYQFAYDGVGRLTAAQYAAKDPLAGTWSLEAGAYDEKGIRYDANGNIQALQRYSQASTTTPRVVLDDLIFSYQGNRQDWVDDNADQSRGFRDVFEGVEYTYDANGNVTRDGNKGVALAYNTLNKVARQTVGANTVTYDYNAAGATLRRSVSTNGVTTTFNYIDGFVYEASATTNGLAWVPTPEGRALVLPDATHRLTYEYHLRDHQGNLRVAFRAQPGEAVNGLSAETSEPDGDYPYFHEVAATRDDAVSAQHGRYVTSLVNGQAAPYTDVPVAHGDRVKVKLYYSTPHGPQYLDWLLNRHSRALPAWALVPALLPAGSRPGDELTATRSTRVVPGLQLTVTGLVTALLAPKKQAPPSPAPTAARPRQPPANAYLVWTLYDQQHQPISSGSQLAPVRSANGQWHSLSHAIDVDLSSVAAGTGYLRVSLVNEGAQPVYFDSLTIRRPTAERLVVSQENHYYPFGMALTGVAVNTAPAPVASKDRYNAGAELQDDLLEAENSLYSTLYRSYDPTIGRFWGVDPLAEAYADLTPFQYAANDPVNFNDPNGDLIPSQDIPGVSEGGYPMGMGSSGWGANGPAGAFGSGGAYSAPSTGVWRPHYQPSSVYIGSYREYDPKNGTYDPIMHDGKWVNPMYYTTVSVYTNPSRVDVYIWKKEMDVGHVAIRVDDLVYGYYPTDVNGDGNYTARDLINSRGEMHINSMQEFNTIYKGDIIKSYSIITTEFQVQLLKYQLNKFAQNPGKYSLFGNNCSSVAYKCLRDGGINIIAYPGATGGSGDLDKYIYWSQERLSNILSEYNRGIISGTKSFVVPFSTQTR
ncbi:hypothetical protein IC235_21610 [Hymenobacter sp. BT664]|uniref:Uncharacterized protein n=1 Tax=Hymenobacter montanus TaxID=2771359 RepID=A0A927BHS6_9BACT|nr:DUF6443 domain-containing protein [Hymenobacter montanus]MBD2770490.1 hypothetical protein [Hymenobacter montanus]